MTVARGANAKVNENRALNVEEVRGGRTRLRSKPLQINLELTGVCDINPPCVFCSGKNFGHNYRPLDVAYIDRYSAFLDHCEHVNEDSFGEPLTHPGLVDTARRFTANGQMFSFVTNGLQLDPQKAEALAGCGPLLGMHVSLNAATAGTFYKLTGKPYDRLVRNLYRYVETYRRLNDGSSPDVTLTFIVMRINRHEVPDFLRLAADLGVRALLAPLHDRPSVPLGRFGYDFVYEDEMLPYPELVEIGRASQGLADRLGVPLILQWDAARDTAVRNFAVPGVQTPCLIPWRYMFIQEHTSSVFACPYHRHPIASLEERTLEQIWNGPEAQEMRRQLTAGEIPKFCWDASSACPLIFEARARGLDRPIESEIAVGRNDVWHLGDGWHHLERLDEQVRWTSRSAGFRIDTRGKRDLVVSWLMSKPDAAADPVRGRVEIEGRTVGRFKLDRTAWSASRYRLPPGNGHADARGRILVDGLWRPSELGMDGDTRQLGVGVHRIAAVSPESEIAIGRNDIWHLGDGWHHLERLDGLVRWTSRSAGFRVDTRGKRHLVVYWLMSKPDAAADPVRGTVEIEGRTVGRFRLDRTAWSASCYRLPPGNGHAEARGRILVDRLWRPSELGMDGDTRQLGVGVHKIAAVSARATVRLRAQWLLRRALARLPARLRASGALR